MALDPLNSNNLEQLALKGLTDIRWLLLGLRLQGAECVNNALKLSSAVNTELPLISLKWVR